MSNKQKVIIVMSGMKENGRMGKEMVKEHSLGLMEKSI